MLLKIDTSPLLAKIAAAAGIDISALPDGPYHTRAHFKGQGHLAVEPAVGGYRIVRVRDYMDRRRECEWDEMPVAYGTAIYATRAAAERALAA